MTITTADRSATVVSSPSGEDTTELPVVTAPPPYTGPAKKERPRIGAVPFVTGVSLTILGAFLLCFVAQLTVVGSLQHARDQQVQFDEFRDQLANGVLPVGQVNEGELVPMGAPVAQLKIPSIGVDEVVGEGTTSSVLMSGPGHRRDTVLPGQAGTSIIAGRQAAYGGPFARLKDLKIGDPITVITGQGEQTFTVTASRDAGDAIAALTAGKSRITLVTAAGTPYLADGTLRVDAEATSTVQPTPTRPFQDNSLTSAELLMKGDAGAWVPIVFWAQALLLASIGVVWASARWGRMQAWIIGVPVLGFVGFSLAEAATRLLPNLT